MPDASQLTRRRSSLIHAAVVTPATKAVALLFHCITLSIGTVLGLYAEVVQPLVETFRKCASYPCARASRAVTDVVTPVCSCTSRAVASFTTKPLFWLFLLPVGVFMVVEAATVATARCGVRAFKRAASAVCCCRGTRATGNALTRLRTKWLHNARPTQAGDRARVPSGGSGTQTQAVTQHSEQDGSPPSAGTSTTNRSATGARHVAASYEAERVGDNVLAGGGVGGDEGCDGESVGSASASRSTSSQALESSMTVLHKSTLRLIISNQFVFSALFERYQVRRLCR